MLQVNINAIVKTLTLNRSLVLESLSVENNAAVSKSRVVSSNPNVGKTFSFCILVYYEILTAPVNQYK